MKSILRINGSQLVVDGVPPASEAFNTAVSAEIARIFGEVENVSAEPTTKLGQTKETLESQVTLIFWGREPGIVAMEFVVKTKEAANEIVVPGFIEFAL